MFNDNYSRFVGRVLVFGLVAALSWGCGEAEEEAHGEEPADDACEHAQDGPFEDVTAADAGGDAPDVSMEHTAYRIGLTETGTDSFSGQVSFTPEEAGEYHVFLGVQDAEVDFSLDGNDIPEESSQAVDSSEHCPEVVQQWTFDLDSAGQAHRLDIANSTDSTVLMVIVHGGDEHHEHEE
jgi:hypothetical protein